MKVLLDILSADVGTTLIFVEDLLIPTRLREAKVDRT